MIPPPTHSVSSNLPLAWLRCSAVKTANLSGSFLVQSYLSTALMFAGVYFLIFLAQGPF